MELKPLELNPEEILPFVQLRGEEDVQKLLPILENRLPYSVFIYNAAVMYPRFRDRMSFYTIDGRIDENSWIVSVVVAEDYGFDYSISALENTLPSAQITEILDKSPLFKWSHPHLFTPLEKWLSSLIFEVSVNRKGNVVEFHPSKIFWTNVESAMKIQLNQNAGGNAIDTNQNVDSTLKIGKLTPDAGVEFILSNWKFAKAGTASVVSRVVSRNESGAVYLNGEPVCGVIFHAFGMLSALHTLPSMRQRGYAQMAMKSAFRQLAQNGIIPASAVDVRNSASISFHQKLGCLMSQGVVDYVIVGPAEF